MSVRVSHVLDDQLTRASGRFVNNFKHFNSFQLCITLQINHQSSRTFLCFARCCDSSVWAVFRPYTSSHSICLASTVGATRPQPRPKKNFKSTAGLARCESTCDPVAQTRGGRPVAPCALRLLPEPLCMYLQSEYTWSLSVFFITVSLC
jgi:hypothetical protein